MISLEKHQKITDFQEGQDIVDFFLVREKSERKKKNGDTYLSLELSDASGKINGKIWDRAEEFSALFQKGDIVKVMAAVSTYRGNNELHINRIRGTSEEDNVRPEDFYPSSPYSSKEMYRELREILLTVEDEDIRKLIQTFFDDTAFSEAFQKSVAARNLHHPYLSGLLEHTLSVVRICDFLASHYPDINRSLLLAGALFHDIGKISELNSGADMDYSTQGILKGHMVIGHEILSRIIDSLGEFPKEKRMLLEHMVLSHQGEREWGAPVVPMTREALLLHFADNMDAKEFIFRDAVNTDKSDSEFTEKVFSMGRKVYKGSRS